MNKILLFFLCNVVVLDYASERSSCPVPFLDMCSVENRGENEDRRAFCRLPNKGHFFGVLDGHCGSEVADNMSRTFPNSFYRYLENSCEHQAFNNAFRDADIYALNNLKGGSAAVFVYINNGIAHVAHVGDSRAIFGNKNRIAFFTQDQTPDRKDEYERITKANGIVYREIREPGSIVGPWRINGLGMSRSIGDRYYKGKYEKTCSLCLPRKNIEINSHEIDNKKTTLFLEEWHNSFCPQLILIPQVGQIIAEPEYTRLPLTSEHRWLIIASDGLWDVVHNEEAMAIVQSYYDEHGCIDGVSALLCDWAIENGSQDNITVLVIDLLDYVGNKKSVDK